MTDARQLHGVLGEYATPEDLRRAARAVRDAGHGRVEAYTPWPVEGLDEALDLPPSVLPRLVFAGGLVGALAGLALQVWVSAVAWPLDVGGRALLSWPAFVVPAFETCILGAALAAVLGMFALDGLPRPHHPLFEVERFEHASRDALFLCVESDDDDFDPDRAEHLLRETGATETWRVPA